MPRNGLSASRTREGEISVRNIARIDIAKTQDDRYFAHVTLAEDKREFVTDEQRSIHLALKRVESIIERHSKE
jgi:hypothetical protein